MDSTISSANRNVRPFPFSKMEVEQDAKAKSLEQNPKSNTAPINPLPASSSSPAKSASFESKFTYSPALLSNDKTQEPRNLRQVNATISSILLDMIPIMKALTNAMKFMADSQEVLLSASSQLTRLSNELTKAYKEAVDAAEVNRDKARKEAAQNAAIFGLLAAFATILATAVASAATGPVGLIAGGLIIGDALMKGIKSAELLNNPELLKDASFMEQQKSGFMSTFGENADKAATFFQIAVILASVGSSASQLAKIAGAKAAAGATATGAATAASTGVSTLGGAAAHAAAASAVVAQQSITGTAVRLVNDLMSLIGLMIALAKKANESESNGSAKTQTAGENFLAALSGGIPGLIGTGVLEGIFTCFVYPFKKDDETQAAKEISDPIVQGAMQFINTLLATRNTVGPISGKDGFNFEKVTKWLGNAQAVIGRFSSAQMIYSSGHNIVDNIHIKEMTDIQNQANLDLSRSTAISQQTQTQISAVTSQIKQFDQLIQTFAKRLQEFASILNSGLANLNPK